MHVSVKLQVGTCARVCIDEKRQQFTPSGILTIWVKELVPGAEQPLDSCTRQHTRTHTRVPAHTVATGHTVADTYLKGY